MGTSLNSIYIGYDPREEVAFQVARGSLIHHLRSHVPVHKLHLGVLQETGLYRRPTERRNGRLIDTLSARSDYDGSISTEHANARFLVPFLAKEGWALFMDGDILVRSDISELFENLDPTIALYCVKHDYSPRNKRKMDGQVQTKYDRKNWSSFMLINCSHPANQPPTYTLDFVNSVPGRDLHAFSWLDDCEIGELGPEYNYLVGHTKKTVEPKVVHFTAGVPDMPGYETCEYAEEWFQARGQYAAAMLSFGA
jgi:lipopolysaccharide biosynthesis glycosyltransferase